MKLFRCEVCGYVYEGEEAIEKCPKCLAGKDKHTLLTEEEAAKIYNSDETNDIHMELVNMAAAMVAMAQRGIELDLDPNCVKVFEKAIDAAWEIKGMCKAELQGHMKKGKW